jgi:hypothetical protein
MWAAPRVALPTSDKPMGSRKMSTAPTTRLHYAPNANLANGSYDASGDPGSIGFNLADISSQADADSLPTGVQGLLWIGGDTVAQAESIIAETANDPKIYGYYVADEPSDSDLATVKAIDDYIAQNATGKVSFIVAENDGTPTAPSYAATPQSTDSNLIGLDPYPVRPQFTNGVNYSVISAAVQEAESVGWRQSQIVPVYQAFGGGGYGGSEGWTLPTAAQEETILSTWAEYTPTPAFDYAYSWGTQDGDTAISDDPALQAVFAAHNAASTNPPDVLTPYATTITATAGQSFSATVATFTDSNPAIAASGLTATINWGDGTTSAGTVTGSDGSFAVTGSHTYSGAGSDTVAVTLSEDPPGTASATADSTATVSAPRSTGAIMTATDRSGVTANVPVITSHSLATTVGEGTVNQLVYSGADLVWFTNIASETLQFGTGPGNMKFLNPGTLTATGGAGADTLSANSGNNTFIAGTGTLTVKGGSGDDSYVFHAGDGLLTIEDFSLTRDNLTVDKSLQGAFQETSDGSGGVMLTFGTADHGIHLVGVPLLAQSAIHFV